MATNSGASDPVPSTADSPGADHGYPFGHAGYLDEEQVEALTEFKRLAEEAGVYTRGPPASIDDAALLRYLRARRWVPEDALQQLADTSEWRQANDIDVLYNTIEVTSYEQSRRMYPQWTGRRDRRGIPLYLFVIKQLDNKSVADYERLGAEATFSRASPENRTSAPGLLRLFALYENLTHFVMPFCTQLEDREFPDAPITMTTNIVDISGVGLKQFWNLKAHMQAASQLATAHYPETLDRIFIIGAPMFFSTVWGWIKRWFDPITVSKIFILSGSEVESTLRQFIDPSNIPKKYGGDLDFSWGDLPTVDPAWDGRVEWESGKKGFPTGPHVWRDIEGGARMECVGLGQRDGVLREERVCVVKKSYFGDVANAAKDRAAAAGEGETATGAAVADAEAKLSDGVAKLDIAQGEAGEKSAAEVNGKDVRESVSPPIPSTVA